MGNHAEAILQCGHMLALAREAGNLYGEAIIWPHGQRAPPSRQARLLEDLGRPEATGLRSRLGLLDA